VRRALAKATARKARKEINESPEMGQELIQKLIAVA
jgi:hypothetical protein